ncbi:hypothetical protein BK648_06560 [Pseudomonas poae]|uniref:Uncharacterized protein n=1 Tax=Pseudomonas poae TaxID=200451 RepID=A0A423FDJ3_9PSED|nr:hypothetical protein [Pseudomonas poae]ROM55155.1 hypothetical protein BK648_06560 [Pseudomonas poae]
MATEKTKKAFWYSAWGLLFLSLAGVLVKQAFEEPPQPSKPDYLSDLIMFTARTMAGNRMIDEDTTFVRAEAANSHAIKFYYTLVNYDTNPNDFDLSTAKSKVTRSVCDSERLKERSIMALGGTYIYIFGSKNVKEIGRFDINKQSCDSQ